MSDFSFFVMPTAKSSGGEMMTLPVEEFLGTIEAKGHAVREEKDGPAFVGAIFPPGATRRADLVEAITAITLDIDGKKVINGQATYSNVDVEQVLGKLEPYCYLAHSTHHHLVPCTTPSKEHPPINKFRVIMPLAEPIGVVAYERLLAWMVELTGDVADPNTRDPCRLFYFPSCTPEGKAAGHPWIVRHEGALLGMAVVPTTFGIVSSAGPSKKRDSFPAVPALLAGSGDEVLDAFMSLPAVKWALEHQDSVSREVWRGLAGNLQQLVFDDPGLAEAARSAFHQLSANYTGYSAAECNAVFDDAASSVAQGKTITVEHMVSHGVPQELVAGHHRTLADAALEATLPAPIDFSLDDPPTPVHLTLGSPEATAAVLADKAKMQAQAKALTKGKSPRAHVLYAALQEVPEWKIRLNEMSSEPWIDDERVTDSTIFQMQRLFDEKKTWSVGAADLWSAINALAAAHPFSPCRDWLNSLKWDGTSRIDKVPEQILRCPALGIDLAGNICKSDEVERQTALRPRLFRNFMVGAVARACVPGCKVDSTFILQEAQGSQKSTFFRILAGEEWFTDSAFDLHNTQSAAMVTAGKWIVEWAELESLKRARDSDAVKSFVSSAVDRYNPKYLRVAKEHKRSFVLVGTTNNPQFLSDSTGNRRFPFLRTGKIDIALLVEQREQLWAEAVAIYQGAATCTACKASTSYPDKRCAAHRWWLGDDEDLTLKRMQDDVFAEDPWTEPISKWVKEPVYMGEPCALTTHNILVGAVNRKVDNHSNQDTSRVIRVMTALGYRNKRPHGEFRRWVPEPKT